MKTGKKKPEAKVTEQAKKQKQKSHVDPQDVPSGKGKSLPKQTAALAKDGQKKGQGKVKKWTIPGFYMKVGTENVQTRSS